MAMKAAGRFFVVPLWCGVLVLLGLATIASAPALAADGTLKWQFQTGGLVYSSPAIGDDGTIFVGSEDYYLYAVNPDGTLK
jgi:outer membrane protein assembly factor BamB